MGFEAIQHDEKEHTKREKRKTNREWIRLRYCGTDDTADQMLRRTGCE
jgi:hypothetical protein